MLAAIREGGEKQPDTDGHSGVFGIEVELPLPTVQLELISSRGGRARCPARAPSREREVWGSSLTALSGDTSCRAAGRGGSHLAFWLFRMFASLENLQGVGVASSSTPRPSLSLAPKSTCPRSLLIAPEFGKRMGSGGITITPITIPSTLPTPGRTVPVRATSRSEPLDHTNKPVSATPSPLTSVLRAALKATSPALLTWICCEPRVLAVINVPPPGIESPGPATRVMAPCEYR